MGIEGVRLRVAERLGVARTDELVRSGVPFPKGVLTSPEDVRLVGPDGEIALDAEALARWDDGSIRWLLLNFPVTLQPNETAEYALGTRCGPASTGALRVEEKSDAFRVDTGAVRFSIDRAGRSLLRDVEVKDARDAWRALRCGGIEFLAANHHWRLYSTANEGSEARVECEEIGSVHAVFRVSGVMVWGTKHAIVNSLDHTCRITCSAGSPSVRVSFTIHNRQEQPMEVLRSLGMRIGVRNQAQPMSSFQTGPTNARPWKEFAYVTLDSRAGKVLRREKRSAGWAGIENESGGVVAAIRRMWQRHPKGFETNESGLTAWLVPPQAEPLVLHQGMDLTEDVLLTFHTAGDRQPAVDASLAFEEPLFAVAEPEWYCSTGAMGWLTPVDQARHPRYEKIVRSSFESLMRAVDEERMYGAVNYGDTCGDYSSEPDYWLNQEYDTPHCCFMMFARSGEIDYLRWGEEAARHQADVDALHFCTDNPSAIGSQYKHEPAHVSYRGGDGLHKGAIDHLWAEGLCEHYLLTGDRRALDVAREVGDFLVRRSMEPNERGNARSYGWPIIALCAVYEATGEESYIESARRVAEQVFARNHPTRGIWLESWGVDENGNELLGNKTFMVGVLMEAMAFYHRITGDPQAAEWLTKSARTICVEAWVEKDKGFYYTPSLEDRDRGRTTDLRELLGLAYAYSLSRDPLLMEIAMKSFDAGQDAWLAQIQEGSVSGKAFATLTRSTPRFVALLDG